MPAALVVIDVQEALCRGPHGAFDADGVVARIDRLAARARQAGVPVLLVQHEAPGTPLARDTAGWRFADGLTVAPGDIVVPKRATDAFHHTDLQATLARLGVDRLVICGLQSDFCVDTSTRRALALGYPVELVSDGHTTVDNGVLTAAQISAHHTATLAAITSFGPRVRPVPAAEVTFDQETPCPSGSPPSRTPSPN